MSAPWLVAFEESGRVSAALRARGYEAWSCDLLPTRGDPDWHIQGDAIAAIYGRRWGGIIAHPVCTYLANSGAKHLYAGMKAENGPNPDRWARMGHAAAIFQMVWTAPVDHLCVENPVMLGHPRRLFSLPKPAQIVQPWWFGHGEQKATGLYLRGLPPLKPTNIVSGREQRIWKMGPGENRQRDRSETFQGIADAFADQWGAIPSAHIQREAA